jgi:Uncharacterized conserved protein, contains RING Zn-finger
MNENNEKYYEKLSEDLCGICYEPFEHVTKSQVYCLKCPNMYHVNCMNNWVAKSGSPKKRCPYCSRRTLKYPKSPRRLRFFCFC